MLILTTPDSVLRHHILAITKGSRICYSFSWLRNSHLLVKLNCGFAQKSLCLGPTVNHINAFHLQQHCLSVSVFVRKLFGSVYGVGEIETNV